jgi:hypothetical protein
VVGAAAAVDVGEVHPDGAHADERRAGREARRFELLHREDLGAAEPMKDQRAHRAEWIS